MVRTGIDKKNPLFWIPPESAGSITKMVTKDFGYTGITPAGIDRWLTLNHPFLWPKGYAELRDLGLGLAICEWLEFEVGLHRPEALVVTAFLKVLHALGLATAYGLKGAVQSTRNAVLPPKPLLIEGDIAAALHAALKTATAQAWPKAVVDFPEGVVG
jgi:hypothetical protein